MLPLTKMNRRGQLKNYSQIKQVFKVLKPVQTIPNFDAKLNTMNGEDAASRMDSPV